MVTYAKYRYGLSLTSQFYFCGVPFRMDTAPKCTLNCLYCFAMSRGGRRTSTRLLLDANLIYRKINRALTENNPRGLDVNGAMLAHRVPLHFGGISDPFSNQLTTNTSLKLIEILNRHQYPTIVSTKNTDQLSKPETIELLRRNQSLVVQISITIADEKLAKAIEPAAPSPENRIRCVQMLSQSGIHTIVRLQPLILPWRNQIVHDLIPALASAGCKHVIVEFLKLPVEKKLGLISHFLSAIEWDAYETYQRLGASLIGREWILPNNIKWQELQPLIASIRVNHMTYGAADYGLTHLGDTDCCCGIDGLKGFGSWFLANFTNVIRKAPSNRLTFQQVAQHWTPSQSIREYVNSHSRLQSNSILDYLRDKWNRPGTVNAPDTYLGVSWTGEHDMEGNCIYVREY